MNIFLTEAQINALIGEEKQLGEGYESKLQLKPKQGHKERGLTVIGTKGSDFRLILRQSLFNMFDFSVILAYSDKSSSQVFRLRRYNGKSHEHTNKIEGLTFYDFHIHLATERYQQSGLREDAYAEPTRRYGDLNGALACLFEDCGFVRPVHSGDKQELLF